MKKVNREMKKFFLKKFQKSVDKHFFIWYNIIVVKRTTKINKGGNNMVKGTPKVKCGKWAYITKKVRNRKIRKANKKVDF